MIQKIDYKFRDEKPFINIDIHGISDDQKGYEDPYLLQTELNQFPLKHIRDIVKKIEEVKKGERDKYIFGFETTMIWVYQKGNGYYGEKFPDSEVTITYNYADDYIVTELTVEDILKMMTEWRDYIYNWEKETGKEYGGI